MKKTKLFLENFFVYGFGGIISKLVPFFMLPVITRLLPDTSVFGINDLANTLVSFSSAIAVFGMYDAMYRMFFEKDSVAYQQEICSTALSFSLISSFVVFVLMLVFREYLSKIFFHSSQYSFLVCISALTTMVSATNSIISAPTRMQNKRNVFLITNALVPLLSYGIAIPLLLNGHYLIALPLAALFSGVFIEFIFIVLNLQWFSLKKFNARKLTQMLFIAIPVIPSFLFYWIFSSCDRLMIINMLGIGESGIYAIGAKLGTASQLIYTAFAGGWQYFAFSTMNESDQVKNNSLVFEYLGIISFSASVFVFALARPFYLLMFPSEYVRGYIASPYLFLAPLMQMLFQVIGNQFLVIKKTWPSPLILFSGAMLNVLLNWLLIPVIGIEGAAVSTLSGYTLVVIVASIVLCKMKLMDVSMRFWAASGIMILFILIWRFVIESNIWLSVLAAIVCCIVFFGLYVKDIFHFLKNVKIQGD